MGLHPHPLADRGTTPVRTGALGKPGARRAVGRANGANHLSIVIPCHRLIEANGNLRGYGGKVWRKKYLLELEAGLKPTVPFMSL